MTGSKAPESYADLRERLQELAPSLTPSQGRIASLILSEPERTAFRSITETAHQAGVHESSVVRFAKRLGLTGYPGLASLCREHLSEQARLVARFESTAFENVSDDLLHQVLEHEHRNLGKTFANIAEDDWNTAVRLLSDARRVHIMGLRKCLPVAQLFTYLLHLVRSDVVLSGTQAGTLPDSIRDMEPDDVFVAVSTRRYTAETVQAFREAKRMGLKTIALTDDASSPIVEADAVFFAATEGLHILRSISPLISVVETLVTSVAMHNEANTRAQLQSDEQLLKNFNSYWESEGGPSLS